MKPQILYISLFYLWHIILAQDPLPGIFRQTKPCFRTKKFRGCNVSLAESFTPESPNVADIEARTLVYLFTPRSPDVAEALHECRGSLPSGTTFDPNANTEVFIHGWLDGVCRTAWMRESKEQLFQRARRQKNSSYNVILVDWTWGNTPDYYIASQNCMIVGEQVGFVINNIMRQTGIGPEKFHVIGHSFGAIGAGFTGRSVPGLGRITGLDPSLSPFINYPPEKRLTYRDAQIVDIIHSNGGKCFVFTNGDIRQLGHADFYPNGGSVQTSCYTYAVASFLKGDYFYALGSLSSPICFHLQSIQYYKLSINPQGCQYVGVAADSYNQFLTRSPENDSSEWAVMGMEYELYRKDNEERKKYYLKTTNKCPYYDDSYLPKNRSYPFKACKT